VSPTQHLRIKQALFIERAEITLVAPAKHICMAYYGGRPSLLAVTREGVEVYSLESAATSKNSFAGGPIHFCRVAARPWCVFMGRKWAQATGTRHG
jgi:hypothetical protein